MEELNKDRMELIMCSLQKQVNLLDSASARGAFSGSSRSTDAAPVVAASPTGRPPDRRDAAGEAQEARGGRSVVQRTQGRAGQKAAIESALLAELGLGLLGLDDSANIVSSVLHYGVDQYGISCVVPSVDTLKALIKEVRSAKRPVREEETDPASSTANQDLCAVSRVRSLEGQENP
ncbi:hypothetical protein T439DRAFT_351191 [Meredithblackwellia eburnea MCA 4105]